MRPLFFILMVLLIQITMLAQHSSDTFIRITQLPPQEIILDKVWEYPHGDNSAGANLSLSYNIIKAHGGEIKVESTEGIEVN